MIMEQNDSYFDRAKFDAVWQRVRGASDGNCPAPNTAGQRSGMDESERLRRFMDGEACDARFYAALACRCPGTSRQALLRIAADEACHLKRLRARYFLLTGAAYTPPEACPLIVTTPDALRGKHADEREGAAAYRAAAEQTPDQELKDTYLCLSQDEARHARTIVCLLEGLLRC